jgi:hypothetical protein
MASSPRESSAPKKKGQIACLSSEDPLLNEIVQPSTIVGQCTLDVKYECFVGHALPAIITGVAAAYVLEKELVRAYYPGESQVQCRPKEMHVS